METKTFQTPIGIEYQSTSDSGCQGAELNGERCDSHEGEELCDFPHKGLIYRLCPGCYHAWTD